MTASECTQSETFPSWDLQFHSRQACSLLAGFPFVRPLYSKWSTWFMVTKLQPSLPHMNTTDKSILYKMLSVFFYSKAEHGDRHSCVCTIQDSFWNTTELLQAS